MPIIIVFSISFIALVISFVFIEGRGVPWVPTSMNLVYTMLKMA